MSKRVLMPHQRAAMRYARRERHPALFMDMRLRKTLVTVRCLRSYSNKNDTGPMRFLIIAPGSALGEWDKELTLEGVPAEDRCYLQGSRKKRLALLAEGRTWCLVNKEGWITLPEIADVSWTAVVLDESTFIKNPRAKVTKFCLSNFRDVPHRWILTGLPAPESVLDYWCQLAWLDGCAFSHKSFWSWRAKEFIADAFGHGWTPGPGVSARVGEFVNRRAFCLSREQAGMRTTKVRQRRTLTLPPRMRKAYELAEKDFILDVTGAESARTIWATTRWHWLRQMCSGVVDGKVLWDGKIRELVTLLKGELAAEQVVVWYAYNDEIDRCRDALAAANISYSSITGEVGHAQRREITGYFQAGGVRVLLLQQAIAETGVALHAADTAIYFSNHPGLQTRAQTEDRIVDLDKKRPLLYLDLIVKDSVEELVLDNLEAKDWNAKRVLLVDLIHGMKERMA